MATVADIAKLLESVQSPDGAVRNEAEQMLKHLETENYSAFLISLCSTFAAEDKPLHIQRLAVIIFKNVVDSKERETKVFVPLQNALTTIQGITSTKVDSIGCINQSSNSNRCSTRSASSCKESKGFKGKSVRYFRLWIWQGRFRS